MAGDGRLVAPLTIVAGGGRQYRDDALRAAKRVFNGGLGMVTLAGIGRVSLGYAQRALTSRSRLISTIRRRPVDVRSWLSLISIEHHDGRLCGDVAEVVAIHRLDRLRSPAHTFAEHIGQKAAPVLTQLGADPVAGLPAAINEIAKWKAVAQCEASHSGDAGYFVAAEERMEWQWHNVIWPFIEGSDFSAVLELACGHGRNTEYLRRRAGVIHLVDINRSCLDACRSRFGDQAADCRLFYHLTDGNHFRAAQDRSITFGYSWDSMVHFDKVVVRDYLIEFSRVLRPGGRAFLHHSNYGAFKPNSDWPTNYGTRSNMSAELLRQYADEAGLHVRSQRLSGTADGWGMDDIDCLSMVEKPLDDPQDIGQGHRGI